MRRSIISGLFVVAVVALAASAGCASVSPGAGEEAVLIYKPWVFGHGGVEPEAVKTGRTYVALSTESVIVSVQPQQFTVHFDDLMSRDGVPLDFDAVIRLRVTNSVQLVSRFGPDWYKANVEAEFRNRVRQEVRKHGMNETAIDSTAIDGIDAAITEAMTAYVKTAALPIELIDITVGKANPPDSVKSQRIETAQQEQRIQTERQKKLAEDVRRSAEEARAAADNAYRQSMQLSPDQFLQLEAIKMQKEVCAGGKCTYLLGGGVVPTLPVR